MSGTVVAMSRAAATMRASGSDLTVVAEPVFHLRVTAGPDAGLVFTLDGTHASRVLLGTSAACDFKLQDPTVSRRHLSLAVSKAVVHVRDLGSTNGTLANGVALAEAFLHGGETLKLGDTHLHVSRGQDDGEPLVSDEVSFGRYLGKSVAMRRLYPLCQRLAASPVPLVIEGETGTGKELLAEALHEASPRAQGPFVVFDCSGVPPKDAEAVLFGREDAGVVTRGLFEEAHGGTLLVDEIADLDLAVQPKLLRAIERGEVRRVSGSSVVPVDVRVIVTTRRDLDREVAEGRFREDLFFRCAVTRIELPPLRERREDVDALARVFWSAFAGDEPFPEQALARVRAYDWPGNVRELENFVTRLHAVGEIEAPRRDSTAPPPAAAAAARDYIDEVVREQLPLTRAREKVVAEFERRYVEDAFERNGKNVTKAAAAAGVARRYFRALRARQRD